MVLLNGEDHKVKEITVTPGQRLSLQRHQKREEHWFIHRGKAKVTLAGKESILHAGQYIDIPRTCTHRIENIGETDLVFIEVQTGDYFGEDDIERIEDDYKRSE
ncbi:MAG: phosphomannose isomerase type II C-terminal cupin domain [Alphaproteobacteria bacterium]